MKDTLTITSRKAASAASLRSACALLLTGCAAPPLGSSSPAATRPPRSTCPASSPTTAASTTTRSTSSASRACSRRPTRSAPTTRRSSRRPRTTTRRTSTSLIAQKLQHHRHASASRSSAAANEAAAANPNIDFAIIDDGLDDNDFDGKPRRSRTCKPVVFDTDQAAFLGGYAAAAYSKTGNVATWGGLADPAGHHLHGRHRRRHRVLQPAEAQERQVLGWDEKTQNGTFTGGFDAGTRPRRSRRTSSTRTPT